MTGTGPDGSTSMAPEPGYSSTSGAPTTGASEPEVLRGIYYRMNDELGATALRGVEIVDGVAQPPFEVLVAPADTSLQAHIDTFVPPRWLPVTARGADPSHFWLVDTETLVPHEVAIAPGSAFDFPRFSDDRTGVILPAAYEAEQPPFTVCVFADDGTCPLRDLDPLLPAGVELEDIREMSGKRGWVVYSTRPVSGDGFDVHFAALDTLDVPVTIASFPTATDLDTTLAPDHGTIYLRVDVGPESLQHFAVDLTTDPPAAPVALHPPLKDKQLAAWWAPDKSALMLFSGVGGLGDLHHVGVDGAVGAMQRVNPGAPGHAHFAYGHIASFSENSARFVYFSDHESAGAAQLYLLETDAPGAAPQLLSGPLMPGEYVHGAEFLPDPGRLIYFVTTSVEPRVDRIVSVELAAPHVTRTLNPPEVVLLLRKMLHSADGSRIAYRGGASGHYGYHFVDLASPEPTFGRPQRPAPARRIFGGGLLTQRPAVLRRARRPVR